MESFEQLLDVCVIGAGPAGLQAADDLRAKGHTVRVLERGSGAGTFFRKFPRHRQLISINKVNTGLSDPDTRLRYDWNSLLGEDAPLFPDVSRRYFPPADDYVSYLENYAERLGSDLITDCEVVRISRSGDTYVLTCADGRQHHTRHVIVATGVSLPWLPDVDGIEHIEVYNDFDPTPERFENKRVLILGKGNSAFETADSLVEHAQAIHVMSPNPVKFAWNTHFVGHLRAVNNNFLDTYQLKSQNAVIDAQPVRIDFDGSTYTVVATMQAADGHEIQLTYDHVIACTGFRFDASILDADLRPEMRHFGKFPAMTAQWECETAPNIWFAGTIMQCRDFKKTMSGFVHGFRHNVACLSEFVDMRLRQADYPSRPAAADAGALTDLIIDRISTASGMFLQPGFLTDVISTDTTGDRTHWRDVPLDWARETLLTSGEALTVTLEFGDFGANPMHVKRRHTAFGDEADPFIHPVLRHWRDGEVIATTHLSDHLDADWRTPDARDPGAGTVTRMTYADTGGTQPPWSIAREQVSAFLAQCGYGAAQMETAAE